MITKSIQPVMTLHFPDGSFEQGRIIDNISIGDKIIFEGQKEYFVVKDIQHQFSRTSADEIMYRMTNVILGKFVSSPSSSSSEPDV